MYCNLFQWVLTLVPGYYDVVTIVSERIITCTKMPEDCILSNGREAPRWTSTCFFFTLLLLHLILNVIQKLTYANNPAPAPAPVHAPTPAPTPAPTHEPTNAHAPEYTFAHTPAHTPTSTHALVPEYTPSHTHAPTPSPEPLTTPALIPGPQILKQWKKERGSTTALRSPLKWLRMGWVICCKQICIFTSYLQLHLLKLLDTPGPKASADVCGRHLWSVPCGELVIKRWMLWCIPRDTPRLCNRLRTPSPRVRWGCSYIWLQIKRI